MHVDFGIGTKDVDNSIENIIKSSNAILYKDIRSGVKDRKYVRMEMKGV